MNSLPNWMQRLKPSNVLKLRITFDKRNKKRTILSLFWGLIKIER